MLYLRNGPERLGRARARAQLRLEVRIGEMDEGEARFVCGGGPRREGRERGASQKVATAQHESSPCSDAAVTIAAAIASIGVGCATAQARCR